VPPDDAGAWSVALRRIVEDSPLRERLRAAGPEHAKRFSWDESARRHLDLFRAVVD
jgi:glycosyltransferase involved in cell wall biosynthesis